ncbi:MAG: cytochrome c maturation protein CcmE [Pseudomonadota bacterium]
MKVRRQRLILVLLVLGGVSVAAALGLNAFRDNLVFFFSPTQVLEAQAPKDRAFRLGGLVEQGSIKREDDGLTVHFAVTDTAKTIPVTYKGILPDLFREGQGVVAQGRLSDTGVFVASEVLAKHDENYMPPEVADAVKKGQAMNAASLKQ